MAIWHELGKKASDTTAKAVHQAKVLGETTKLNSMISDENKKIEQIYSQLGKAYAQTHRDDYESCFGDLMEMLKASETKIKEYTEQVNGLRGVVTCPKCGAVMAEGTAFCCGCGNAMPKKVVAPVATSTNVCTKCGAALMEGAKFCTGCGSAVVPKLVEASVPVVEEPVVVLPTCGNCGAVLEEGAVFCTKCGTPVAPKAVEVEEPVVAAPPEEPVVVLPTCGNCGAGLEDGALFCTECGTPAQSAAVVNAPRTCKACGAELDPDAIFCTECGTRA